MCLLISPRSRPPGALYEVVGRRLVRSITLVATMMALGRKMASGLIYVPEHTRRVNLLRSGGERHDLADWTFRGSPSRRALALRRRPGRSHLRKSPQLLLFSPRGLVARTWGNKQYLGFAKFSRREEPLRRVMPERKEANRQNKRCSVLRLLHEVSVGESSPWRGKLRIVFASGPDVGKGAWVVFVSAPSNTGSCNLLAWNK